MDYYFIGQTAHWPAASHTNIKSVCFTRSTSSQ